VGSKKKAKAEAGEVGLRRKRGKKGARGGGKREKNPAWQKLKEQGGGIRRETLGLGSGQAVPE